jgi:hypothetical protein
MIELSDRTARVLEGGTLLYVAASTPLGPHLTPTVFAFSGGDLWLTTSRGSVKSRAWTRDARVAGLVRGGDSAVSFAGTVRTYDALDARTWAASVVGAPALTAATLRFTRKNARFFAGYAVDARDVPLAWTPPGRVFARVEIERLALIADDRVAEVLGSWPSLSEPGATGFRTSSKPDDPLAGLPDDVADRLGRGGDEAALAIQSADRDLMVLPASWTATDHELYAAVHREIAALAGTDDRALRRVALAADRASWWRARDMSGVMVRGEGRAYEIAGLTSGSGSAARIARSAGIRVPDDVVLVRIDPDRLVWWLGWSSGSVVAA